MNLDSYQKLLANTDWWYHFSDDGNVWRNGERRATELKEISKISTFHLELYNSWCKWYSDHMQGNCYPHPDIKDYMADTRWSNEFKKQLMEDINNSYSTWEDSDERTSDI